MKLSISGGTGKVALPQIVFKGDLETVFNNVRKAGYDGVDLFLTSAREVRPGALRELSESCGVKVAMLSAMGDLIADRITLSSPDPKIRAQFFSRAPYHLEQAAEVGALVPVGFSRGGILPGETGEEYLHRLRESLKRYDEMAGTFGVRLIIEPINRYEINSLNTADEALALLRTGEYPHTGLLLDLFHMNIEDASIPREILKAADYIEHVHFTDSNRLSPGLGHTDLKEAYLLLKSLRYEGYFGIEALPLPDPETAAAFGMEYMQLLKRQEDTGHRSQEQIGMTERRT